jgi:tripartite-type tricarboxylate transporter receptor subunit TctC
LWQTGIKLHGAWIGIGAPKNIPTEIVERLNKEVNAALAGPKM